MQLGRDQWHILRLDASVYHDEPWYTCVRIQGKDSGRPEGMHLQQAGGEGGSFREAALVQKEAKVLLPNLQATGHQATDSKSRLRTVHCGDSGICLVLNLVFKSHAAILSL